MGLIARCGAEKRERLHTEILLQFGAMRGKYLHDLITFHGDIRYGTKNIECLLKCSAEYGRLQRSSRPGPSGFVAAPQAGHNTSDI